jgi:hypothetical protein
MDTSDYDINTLMPLISGIIDKKQAQKLSKLAFDKKQFLQENGLTMLSASHENYDPKSSDGAGGLLFYWQTLIGEGLLEAGFGTKVTDFVKSNLKMLVGILVSEHEFAQFYDCEAINSLGEKGHIAGIAPLYLLQRLYAVQIVSNSRVWIGKEFAWGRAITIRQHGVYVRKTNKGTKIEFPSGHVHVLDAKLKEDTWIEDPKASEAVRFVPIELPETVKESIAESKPAQAESNRIVIEVEYEE